MKKVRFVDPDDLVRAISEGVEKAVIRIMTMDGLISTPQARDDILRAIYEGVKHTMRSKAGESK